MDGNKGWLEVSLECSAELAEVLSEALSRFAKNGVVIESITTFDADNYEFKATGNVRVVAYLEQDSAIEETRQKLEETLWHYNQIMAIPTPEYKLIQEQDWMAAWKKQYKPIKVGQSWLILPAWMEAQANEMRTIIRIDPAMAFGTGTHPSTQLCLLAIEKYMQPGEDMIDLGCGSGILSIAALKIGAAYALAVDTDEQAVLAAQNNAVHNGIHAHLDVHRGSLDDILHKDYAINRAPFVVANILAPVILKMLKEGLASLLTPGGTLVLAGILGTQVDEVVQAVNTAGLSLIEQFQDGDWVGLVVSNVDTDLAEN